MDTQDAAVQPAAGRREVHDRFSVGQSIVLKLEAPEHQDVYQVTRCLPTWPDSEPLYRIRSKRNRGERVVRESEMKPADLDHQPS